MAIIKMILTNGYDPDTRVLKEAEYIVSKGHDLEILCWDRENTHLQYPQQEVGGVKVKRFFPKSQYGTKYKQIIPYLEFIKECKKYIKNSKYDFLHCHDLDGTIAGVFVNSKNKPIIFDMHEYYTGRTNNKILKLLLKSAVNYCQGKSYKIIHVNETQRKGIKSKNIEKLLYLPNYPFSKHYESMVKTDSEKLRISYIGVVRQYDQLKLIMDAALELDRVQVNIHGSGVAYNKLMAIKHKYPNTSVTGRFDSSQSAGLYGDTDILYAVYNTGNLNWKTSYPVKFYEAIITKTPIIVSNGTAVSKYVKHNNIGFSIDETNVDALRKLIKSILSDRSILDKIKENYKSLDSDFEWEKVVIVLDNIYG